MVDGRYYTIQQAAEILSCDNETVLAWIHSGELTAVNLAKTPKSKRPTWRIAEVDMGRFLIARRNQASQQLVKTPATAKRPAAKQYV